MLITLRYINKRRNTLRQNRHNVKAGRLHRNVDGSLLCSRTVDMFERANSSELIWASWLPNDSDDHDCLFIFVADPNIGNGYAGYYRCTLEDPGICEKQI